MKSITSQQIIDWAAELLEKCDKELTEAERREQLKYATLIKNPSDKIFLSKLLDESSQIKDNAKLARRIKVLIDEYGIPKFFPTSDRMLLLAYKHIGYQASGIAVPIFKKRLRSDTAGVIIDEQRPRLTDHLALRAKGHIGQNVNLLGEVVLSNNEADKRYHHYLDALKESDINYISIKVSGIYAQLHPLNFKQARVDLIERLTTLYRAAIDNPYIDESGNRVQKFVNLDMEEYKDAHLTLDVLFEVLGGDQFLNYAAGIVVQCYLPDCEGMLRDIIEFSRSRVSRGGAPIKIRLVKGANQQMEEVVSSLRGWASPIRKSKVEVDAAYMRMVDIALEPSNIEVCTIGIASHNLFTISYAYNVARERGVENRVTFEMLEGMAPNLWRAMTTYYGVDVILYTPVVKDENFLNAVSYLVRRLDENTGPENFLSFSFGLKVNSKEWLFLQQQFEQALAIKDSVPSYVARTQNRITGASEDVALRAGFNNEPDTNFDLQANKEWAQGIVDKWEHIPRQHIKLHIGEVEIESSKEIKYEDRVNGNVSYSMGTANGEQVERMIDVADKHKSWGDMTLEQRSVILNRAADNIASRRGDLIGCMCSVTSKTITEGDVEVSEAIDFCRFYPHSMAEFDGLAGVEMSAKGVVLVISPWNFPLAIPIGGVVAALTSGNRVIIKPATVAAPVMWEAARCLWDAGVPREALQVVITDGREALGKLCNSPIIKHIILTGGTDTAQTIAANNPTVSLSAETGGKNTMILTSSGDRDKTIMNAVASAFGNAGQKCSACSLLLVERDIFEDASFKAKLHDAAMSLKVGSPWDLGTVVGPMITNNNDKLMASVDNPKNREHWLIAPQFLDDKGYILRPTILWGVEPLQYEAHTELFAPLLAVGSFDGIDEAIDIVNSLDYGLTSGLQSLDDNEIEKWKSNIVAGNLYINRGITGAVVNRQPFGGMKLSAFGGGIKAGGVNYVSCFVNFKSSALRDDFQEVYASEFEKPRDVNNIKGEQNIFRYLPLDSMVLRVMEHDSVDDIKTVCKASIIAGTPLTISMDIGKDDTFHEKLETLGCPVVEQNMWEFISSMSDFDRVRTLSSDIPIEIYKAASGLNKYIANAAPVKCGRVELLHYLKEQSIAYEYHRYGSITEIPKI